MLKKIEICRKDLYEIKNFEQKYIILRICTPLSVTVVNYTYSMLTPF